MNEKEQAILAEQLKQLNILFQARINRLEAQLDHLQALDQQRLSVLEEQMRDHESRLRLATEGVTQFKIVAGLASGGSGIISLVAILRSFLGG